MDIEGREKLLDALRGVDNPNATPLPGVKVLTQLAVGEDLRDVDISVAQGDREALYGVLVEAGMQEDPRVERPDRSLPWLRVMGSGKPDRPGFDVVQFRDLNADRVPA